MKSIHGSTVYIYRGILTSVSPPVDVVHSTSNKHNVKWDNDADGNKFNVST